MATRNRSNLSLGDVGSMDVVDTVVSNAYVLAGAQMMGIATISMLGVSADSPVVTLGSTAVTISYVVSMLALAVMWATNDRTLRNMDGRQTLGVAGLFGLITAVEFVPGVKGTLTSSPAFGIPVFIVMGIGYYFIAFRW